MKFILGCAVSFLIGAYAPHLEASNGGRGGIPSKIDFAGFSDYITEGGLKASMINYINTLKLDLAPRQESALFSVMLKNGQLQQDIMSPNNYLIGLEKCQATNNVPDVRAWTHTGKNGVYNIGGPICFDVERLVQDYKDLSVKDAVVKLVALAFHEHVHHFQYESDDQAVVTSQENDANVVGGYVELTAELAQIPLIQWSQKLNSRCPTKLVFIKRVFLDDIEPTRRECESLPGLIPGSCQYVPDTAASLAQAEQTGQSFVVFQGEVRDLDCETDPNLSAIETYSGTILTIQKGGVSCDEYETLAARLSSGDASLSFACQEKSKTVHHPNIGRGILAGVTLGASELSHAELDDAPRWGNGTPKLTKMSGTATLTRTTQLHVSDERVIQPGWFVCADDASALNNIKFEGDSAKIVAWCKDYELHVKFFFQN